MFGFVFGTLGFGQNDVDLAVARAATANPRPLRAAIRSLASTIGRLGAALVGTIAGLGTVLPGCLGAAPALGVVA